MLAALIASIILILGGLNWMLIGIFDWNMITAIFGTAIFSRILYVLVGLAALYMIYYIIMQAISAKSAKTKTSSRSTTRKTTSV